MPGGRLTQQDRQRIADGLVKGLTYTEIAGLLDRPISTVTREVARNGGPGGYRAGQAQRATQSRARRGRPAPPSPHVEDEAEPGRDAAAVRDVEERFTGVVAATGLSRMTARVLTCLYLTDSGSLTAAELVRRLRVSPASVSKAVGELEQQHLIRRERDPRRRRDRYVIDADVWFRGWTASAGQNLVLADLAREAARVLGVTTPAGMRLQDIGDFFRHVSQAMIEAAEQWSRDYAARKRRDS
ncbi:MarR family transcriptional regulator [Nonomuraea sp. NPDC050790]|uniref:GbsR/MarR family transcriptional regulator n=1 Tax=Nonomuraea sp. NPDC050790 TaxID=3364371 RepID=UPI0037A54DD7